MQAGQVRIVCVIDTYILYSQKIWRVGGLYYNCQIKIRQNFLLAYIHMVIPYRTTKFKSANILAIAGLHTGFFFGGGGGDLTDDLLCMCVYAPLPCIY